MPRKPMTTEPTAALNMRLPMTLREKLIKMADTRNTPMTTIVIEALEAYLKDEKGEGK
jgi:predicted DNA-binding protein